MPRCIFHLTFAELRFLAVNQTLLFFQTPKSYKKKNKQTGKRGLYAV